MSRVRFSNAGSHPHTIHFHGTHPPGMDGVFPIVEPGQRFTYEFPAKPFGVHPYHCHAIPLKRHIHKGLYGTLIVDPPGGRPPARELVMVMNGFDTNFDGENEVYAVNTAAFYYQTHPIRVGVGEPVRIYLVNLTEFDPINSLHLHAGMFRYYRTGTRPDQYELTDTIMLCQGERGIVELRLDELHRCGAAPRGGRRRPGSSVCLSRHLPRPLPLPPRSRRPGTADAVCSSASLLFSCSGSSWPCSCSRTRLACFGRASRHSRS
ncbi:MAG: multicopper oxidase domain-containing protein [Gemmatimonadales bacterium]